MSPADAYGTLDRAAELAARLALGDGLTRDEVADELELVARAIRHPQDVAEDMSPIVRNQS